MVCSISVLKPYALFVNSGSVFSLLNLPCTPANKDDNVEHDHCSAAHTANIY